MKKNESKKLNLTTETLKKISDKSLGNAAVGAKGDGTIPWSG